MSKIVLGESFQGCVEDIVAAAMIEAVKLWGLDGDRIAELIAQRIIEGPLETDA